MSVLYSPCIHINKCSVVRIEVQSVARGMLVEELLLSMSIKLHEKFQEFKGLGSIVWLAQWSVLCTVQNLEMNFDMMRE